jgi:ZIP family zinc transporter
MKMVLLTALGVGGATVIGALIGFCFRKISHKFSDIILSFAAGVMLAAAILGLILPSLEYGGKYGIIKSIIGIFAGALFLNVIDKVVPHLHRFIETDNENYNTSNANRILLFVLAIAESGKPPSVTLNSRDNRAEVLSVPSAA